MLMKLTAAELWQEYSLLVCRIIHRFIWEHVITLVFVHVMITRNTNNRLFHQNEAEPIL
jgi:hypothetical protein